MGLTVWSVCTGDKYPPAYVYALRDAVRKHLTGHYVFKCVTEHDLPGIDCHPPPTLYRSWWDKLGLFWLARGPSLYFDLDVVITGSLDYLVPYTQNQLAAPANWAQSGHGGIQSSVMAWSGIWHDPYLNLNHAVDSKRLWGDQEYLWEMLGDNWVRLPGIYSYKYHCRNQAPPDDMAVCVFHGDPKPHQVTDEWISRYTSTLHYHIKSSTGRGSKRDLTGTLSLLK